MLRYTVTNLVTSSVYHFTDADLQAHGETLEDWLALKAFVYGHPERRFPASGADWHIEDSPSGLLLFTDGQGSAPLRDERPSWYSAGTPSLDGADVVVPTERSVQVEDITTEVQDAQVASIWQERYARETDPSYGVSPMGAGVLLLGVQAGNDKALAIQEWGRQLHAEAAEREAIIRAGETPPVEWRTPREKPHSISEIASELGL